MRVLSVNVGLPRELEWNGKIVRTSISKQPVTGRVRVARLNVEGDQQSDLTVHGGPEKAVYAYPSEHYPFWRGELAKMDLAWGVFGENFTTTGLLEETLHIGDRVRIGSAEFVVTQPRMPCFKLGIRFNRSDMDSRYKSYKGYIAARKLAACRNVTPLTFLTSASTFARASAAIANIPCPTPRQALR